MIHTVGQTAPSSPGGGCDPPSGALVRKTTIPKLWPTVKPLDLAAMVIVHVTWRPWTRLGRIREMLGPTSIRSG